MTNLMNNNIQAHLNVAIDESLTSCIKDLIESVTCEICHVNFTTYV